MDAARSAKRSGAATVTIVYRRGRKDMPAQEEEIEAAVREGIVIADGLAPTEVVGRDGAVVAIRVDEMRPTGETGAGGRDVVGPDRRHARAARRRHPRRHRRGARPVDPPRGRRHRGQRLGRHRRRPADPCHGSRRDLRRRRRRLRPQDDHRGRGRRPARGRIHPRVPRRRAGRRGGDLRRRPVRDTRRSRSSASTSRSDPAFMPRSRSSTPSSFSATAPGFTEAAAHAEASRCFRCDAVYGCPSVSVQAGRGPADSRTGPIPVPAAIPADQPSQGGVQ